MTPAEAKKLKIMLIAIGGAAGALLVFGAGIAVGYQRGLFASRFGEEYVANFHGMPGAAPMNPHGAAGTVLDVDPESSTISVTSLDGDEQSVAVSSDTIIREMNDTISIVRISPGDHILVIGAPDGNGQIGARFIRIFSGTSSAPDFPPSFQ